MTEIEIKSHAVFRTVCMITKNKVVNGTLSRPNSHATNRNDAMLAYHSRLNQYQNVSFKQIAARHWFILASILLASIYTAASKNKSEAQGTSIGIVLIILLLTLYSKKTFGFSPFESLGGYFLNNDDKKKFDLEHKNNKAVIQTQRAGILGHFSLFSGLNSSYENSGLDFYDHECIVKALFATKNDAFDCVSISAMVILKLIESGYSEKIERFYKIGQISDPHSYVVVNRTAGNSHDFHSWNTDAILIDPWYRVCKAINEIRETPNFFFKYPLLDPIDKETSIIPKKFSSSEYCLTRINKLNALIQDKQRKIPSSAYEKLGLDLIFPHLGSMTHQSNDLQRGYFHSKSV